MNGVDDVLIVGAGPAGLSAALALAELGRRVRLVDAGEHSIALPPAGAYATLRFRDPQQWLWQLGRDFESMGGAGAASPKLRVPGFQRIFANYADANRLRTDGFQLVGALAAGGLSNAWGCGVAKFSAEELGPLADDASALDASFERVANRMGLSGASEDALRDYLRVDAWSDPALPLDAVHARLWRRRARAQAESGFRLGRARVAVLSAPRGERDACDLSGMCLWGCRRGATWSAAHHMPALQRSQLVQVDPGVVVRGLRRHGDAWEVHATVGGAEPRNYRARRVLLGAGTVASTRLVLGALAERAPAQLRLQSNPMAAFLLCLPDMLGRADGPSFGLAQLSYVLERAAGTESAFGNLFSTAGLPVSEFLPYLPVSRRAGLPLLRTLLPACIVGNVFLPGALSDHRVSLSGDEMTIMGGAAPQLDGINAAVEERLRRGFRRLGAWMLPGSFVPGAPGADLHYASTLPISRTPRVHECRIDGGIAGLPGVYAIDGASLPLLPAKAHTLTIMANADRIARALP